MEIETNYRELDEISADELSRIQQAVSDWPEEDWDGETRQSRFRAHDYTSSIILCFGPDDDIAAARYTSIWPRWQTLLDPLLQRITKTHFGEGGKIVRLMIVRLYVGAKVLPHTDDLPVLHRTHRIHIPIRTSKSVIFVVGDEVIKMREGQVVEINNQREHFVVNASKRNRIHLIFDYATADEVARSAAANNRSDCGAVHDICFGSQLMRNVAVKMDGSDLVS